MLTVLMFHRIGRGKHASSIEAFEAHLNYLSNHYSCVLPGDPLECVKRPLLITFDDGTYDFYHYVYPLLKKYSIKVLLGLPVRYLLDQTSVPKEERLQVPYGISMQDDIFEALAPFCTWEEVREMVSSGLIEVACHSYAHKNLTYSFVKLEQEIVEAKQILEHKTGQAVSSFIYPFGKWNPRVDEFVKKHYLYSFRIGSAFNWGWGKKSSSPLCRIPADQLESPLGPLTLKKKIGYFFKTLSLWMS